MATKDSKMGTQWADFDQLRKKVDQQNKTLNSYRNPPSFDPHKYFGGWEAIERSSIDMIQLDNRLKEMMEYETSNASMSQSYSSSIASETQGNPSVADELEPTPEIELPKNQLFDFKLKPENENSKIINTTKKEVQKLLPERPRIL